MRFVPHSAHQTWAQFVDVIAGDEVLRFSLLAAGVMVVMVLIASACEGEGEGEGEE